MLKKIKNSRCRTILHEQGDLLDERVSYIDASNLQAC